MRQHIPHQVAKYGGVLERVLEYLYHTDMDRLNQQIDRIMERQAQITNRPVAGIRYMDAIHTRKDIRLREWDEEFKPSPHLSLVSDMQAYLQATQLMEAEKQNLRQALVVALRRCNEDQDIRDMLPDCAVKGIPELFALPRTRPVGYLFAGSPTLSDRYAKAVQKMEMLSIVKLFY